MFILTEPVQDVLVTCNAWHLGCPDDAQEDRHCFFFPVSRAKFICWKGKLHAPRLPCVEVPVTVVAELLKEPGIASTRFPAELCKQAGSLHRFSAEECWAAGDPGTLDLSPSIKPHVKTDSSCEESQDYIICRATMTRSPLMKADSPRAYEP